MLNVVFTARAHHVLMHSLSLCIETLFWFLINQVEQSSLLEIECENENPI